MIRDPLPLGTKVRPYGTIEAVMLTGGERYYMLIDSHGGVALMPASIVEPRHEAR